MARQSNQTAVDWFRPIREGVAEAVEPQKIQMMNRKSLTQLQERFGLGTWGVIEFPYESLPPGTCRGEAHRRLDISQMFALVKTTPDELHEIILTITQYLFVCLVVPMSGSRVGSVLLSPSTIMSDIRQTVYIFRLVIQCQKAFPNNCFGTIHIETLSKIISEPWKRKVINRLIQLKHRGYWRDAPSRDAMQKAEELQQQSDACPSEEVGTRVAQAKVSSGARKEFLPLSDEFIGEMGWRSAWFVREFEPSLIKCVNGIALAITNCAKLIKGTHRSIKLKISEVVKAFLKDYQWTSVDGTVLVGLPFQLHFSGRGNRTAFEWPPKNLAHVQLLMSLAQKMHLQIALLSLGGRISEVLSLNKRDYLDNSTSELRVSGRTFKLESAAEGAPKDWPMPELLWTALERQRELVRFAGKLKLEVGGGKQSSVDNGDGLWVGLQKGATITTSYNEMLISAAKVLGLSHLLGDIRIHAHRFRKTIARLMALAIVGAPKILMDFFGHESIEMTLHYILTDPLIRQEMAVVAKAQIVMLAENAITGAEENGGPAAERIRTAVREQKARLGDAFGAADLHMLAETLTLSGTHWMLVRPGVICTKLPQQAGACNERRGEPDASRCRSFCDHRLELSILKEDVDRSIAYAVNEAGRCEREGDPIGLESWRGQILANVNRFPTLRGKWAENPLVIAAFQFEAIEK